jgi:hypothetical protein
LALWTWNLGGLLETAEDIRHNLSSLGWASTSIAGELFADLAYASSSSTVCGILQCFSEPDLRKPLQASNYGPVSKALLLFQL